MDLVRRAGHPDLPELETLLYEAVRTTSSRRGTSLFRHPERTAPPPTRLRSALVSPDGLVLVALSDETMIGLALSEITTTSTEGAVTVVEELYVRPAPNQAELLQELLGETAAWSGAHGCSGIDVAALPGDRLTKNACEAAGFRARLLVMHRRLSD